jgi:hypothetical protein
MFKLQGLTIIATTYCAGKMATAANIVILPLQQCRLLSIQTEIVFLYGDEIAHINHR